MDADYTLIAPPVPSTDLSRWRLESREGEHWWHYLSEEESKKTPQTFAEKRFLGLPTVRSTKSSACGKT